MALYLLFPFILIGAAAATGFGTSWLFTGMQAGQFNAEDRLKLSVGLAVAVPVVAAATTLLPGISELQELYGAFLSDLWLWAAGAFVIGSIFGWAFCAQAE
ncbi:MAG: hypothetical protein Q7T86_17230 [Hyphomicrobiaceae bacterium]|nr:hypothetical protein [Hyphomicrobiaceae bacterium]